jgi:hypothetical protein
VLFHTTWEFHSGNSEEAIQRNLAFFSQWKPPEGFEVKGFWGYADGSGGVAIVETDSAATIAKATAPFTPWLRFTTTPILPIEEASAIAGEAAGGARFLQRLVRTRVAERGSSWELVPRERKAPGIPASAA